MMYEDVRNGSDLLLYAGTSATDAKLIAYATSTQIARNSETKERKTKESGLWMGKRVTKLSVTIKCDALVSVGTTTDTTKLATEELKTLWRAAKPVYLEYRKEAPAAGDKWEAGMFTIDSLDETDQAADDSTFTASFSNSGEVASMTGPKASA